jgi:hypothetical protein
MGGCLSIIEEAEGGTMPKRRNSTLGRQPRLEIAGRGRGGSDAPAVPPKNDPTWVPLSRSSTFNGSSDNPNFTVSAPTYGSEVMRDVRQYAESPSRRTSQMEPPLAPSPGIGPAETTNLPPRLAPAEEVPIFPDFSQWSADDLVREVSRLYSENIALKNISSSAAMEINSLKTEKNFHRDDDFFVDKVEQLRYKIRNWSGNHFGTDMPHASLKTGKEFVTALTFDAEHALSLFASNSWRPLLVQAVLWDTVAKRVLSRKGNLWAGDMKGHLTELQERLNPSESWTSESE